MRIALHIALQIGVLVSAGAVVTIVVADDTSAALEAREQVRNDARDLATLNRLAEGVEHLFLIGDLVLGGGTTYLASVGQQQSASLQRLLDELAKSPLLEERSEDCERLHQDLVALEEAIGASLELEGADRPARLAALLLRFDEHGVALTGRLDDLQPAVEELAIERGEQAEQRVAASQTEARVMMFALLGLILASGIWLQRATARPLRRLARRARDAREGQCFEVDASGPTEVRELAQSFSELVGGLERARNGLEMTVAKRTRALEKALATRSAFLANTSHELRTPLNAMLGFADLLAEGNLPEEERQECLRHVRGSGRHLLVLIEDLLDLSTIEAGQMQAENKPLSPAELLRDLEEMLAGSAKEKRLALQLNLDPAMPARILGDAVRLRQIVVNLVSNAIKFTTTGHVRVNAGWMDGELRIAVADTGVGIPREKQHLVFEAFEQGDTSDTRRFGGTGLGLSISKRLAQLLGGTLTLESELGVGSVFRLHIPAEALPKSPLPARDSGAHASGDSSGASPGTAPGTLMGSRILLVDDVPTNRLLIRRMLQRMQVHVEEAENGRDALERFQEAEAAGAPFDAILMDLQMPVMDGYEATSALRKHNFRGPILAVSAAVLPEQRQRALDVGCDAFLSKPVAAKELREGLALRSAWSA